MRMILKGMRSSRVIVAAGLHPSGGSAAVLGGADRVGLCGGQAAGTTQSFRHGAEEPRWRGAFRTVLLLMLFSLVCVAGEHGVTARFVPEQVRPGEVFELRVEMKRADYGRFALQVPPHGSLHRVAVESEPVKLEDGHYWQRESWVLQADRSGEIVIEGASVVMSTGAGEVPVVLPPLRMEVLPWGTANKSPAPAGWPVPQRLDVPRTRNGLWLVVLGLVWVAVVAWIIGRRLKSKPKFVTRGMPLETLALNELDAGILQSAALERLLLEKGREWSAELQDMVSEAAYAGRGDPHEVADRLRREVGRFEPEVHAQNLG